ncbi:D-glycero-alpha-D-manno-heptose-1,7-bisphosphate 7-phosphatase [Mucisphaera sp.]|uniref:D-glycero-alpha-D-manno-heptose-1,7-bisphosphate 7-phosphatase n=1 Tax=Mucisphaera sp. TaxID=2913024 RepID=UPI003D0CEB76
MSSRGPGWPVVGGQRAVFLDRDGTVIEDRDYLADPDGVALQADAVESLRRLRDAGYLLAIVTNQSGIGRGWMTAEDAERCNRRTAELLEPHGIHFVGMAFSGTAPATDDRRVVEHFERKPGAGMLVTLAREHGIDLTRSWMVGDAERDVVSGRHAGCQGTVLVDTGGRREPAASGLIATARVGTLREAADVILSRSEGCG